MMDLCFVWANYPDTPIGQDAIAFLKTYPDYAAEFVLQYVPKWINPVNTRTFV